MNKRIFLIIPTLHQGGAERVIAMLANDFSHMGIETHILLLAKSTDFYNIDVNVKIHRLNFESTTLIMNIYSQINIIFRIIHLIMKYKPDSILSFMTKYNVLTIILGYLTRTDVYVSDRSNPNKKLPLYLELLRRITYPKAKGIIAQTSLAKKCIHQTTKHNNVIVIPNPVKKITLINNLPKQKIILNIGRLVPEKGHEYLIKAFARLPHMDWKLVILGEGNLREPLNKLILNLGVEDRVLLPGITKDIDVWLNKSSIFALSSISEGFPNALIEAMSSGLPCVSFDCDAGPRDIIKHRENGLLVKSKDTLELTNSLDTLINNPYFAKKISNNAKKINNQLAKEIISKKYLDFILPN